MSRRDILVIDDTPANLHVLCSVLDEHKYEARAAISGQMGLTAARSSRPDLILLDINLPDIGGLEVCEILKQEPDLAAVPVVFVSAHVDAEQKSRAYAVGGADYLTKPLHMIEVIARVDLHMRILTLTEELRLVTEQLDAMSARER